MNGPRDGEVLSRPRLRGLSASKSVHTRGSGRAKRWRGQGLARSAQLRLRRARRTSPLRPARLSYNSGARRLRREQPIAAAAPPGGRQVRRKVLAKHVPRQHARACTQRCRADIMYIHPFRESEALKLASGGARAALVKRAGFGERTQAAAGHRAHGAAKRRCARGGYLLDRGSARARTLNRTSLASTACRFL